MTTTTLAPHHARPDTVDPRGTRFAAAITSLVLAIALVTASAAVLAVQTVVFALGAALGVRSSPYGRAYALLLRPRLAPPTETEDAAPPRFAQAVGLVFALVGLAGYLTGLAWLGAFATGLALGAALLNATTGFCLGCEIYLLARRVTHRPHLNIPSWRNAS